jgi:hypothetical protein
VISTHDLLFPDGVWRAERYHYLSRGTWHKFEARGMSEAECDAKAITWLSTMPGGGAVVIIRLHDQTPIWQGIEWPKGARPPPRSWAPKWVA